MGTKYLNSLKDNKDNPLTSAKNQAFNKLVKKETAKILTTQKKFEDSNIPVWKKNFIYELSLMKYSPVIKPVIMILKQCTKNSIMDNYDMLYKYLHDIRGYMDETTEYFLEEIMSDKPTFDFNAEEFKKEIFITKWDNDKELPLCGLVDNDKNNYYCLYFSKNHTPEDVKRYIECNLRKEIKTNLTRSKTKKRYDNFAQKSLIGYLTSMGESPANIPQYLKQCLGINCDYGSVNKIYSHLKEKNWFKDIGAEYGKLHYECDSVKSNLLKEAKVIIEYVESGEYSKLAKLKPARILELYFIDGKTPQFHIRPVS